MGRDVGKRIYSVDDYQQFEHRLYQQLQSLEAVMSRPTFGQEPLQLGAELEMYLIDDQSQVSLSNQQLLTDLNDPQFQHELNQYNIELNLTPVSQQGAPFSALLAEMTEKTTKLSHAADKHGVNVLPIGILPTLKAEQLNVNYMTDIPRYHCLAKHLYQQRGEPFHISINSEESVSVDFNDICAEGANTSFQFHLMTPADRFADIYNAAQLTLPLVTAISANSAVFLGKLLWDETRISLFKQSLDVRLLGKTPWQQPTRVNFGFGWLRQGALELYKEAVALYPPLLPVISHSPSKGSTLPRLSELTMHMGTVWPWHRPVYCHQGNGHVRIEFRAIPAGPTAIDMLANAAFAVGLAFGVADDIEQYLAVLPFRFAEYNFYRAAQHGIDAKILWPLTNHHHAREVNIIDVICALLPIAKKGLAKMGVEQVEADSYLAVIEQRLEQQITGAKWQKHTLKALRTQLDNDEACQLLVQQYLHNSKSGQPLAAWERIWQ